MKSLLKIICILSALLIPVTAFEQGSIPRPGKGGGTTPSTKNKINGHEYVDLGLPSGLKWATCNVGAKSPSDYGSYFAWGEIHTKSNYAETNSLTYDRTMDDITGNADFDAARANWGGTWRLPTKEEFEELLNKCKWSFITMDNHKGYKVTGPNGKYIFLPAAGCRGGSSLYSTGSSGFYWSSAPSASKGSYSLYFGSDYRGAYGYSRDGGQSVRPVSE